MFKLIYTQLLDLKIWKKFLQRVRLVSFSTQNVGSSSKSVFSAENRTNSLKNVV